MAQQFKNPKVRFHGEMAKVAETMFNYNPDSSYQDDPRSDPRNFIGYQAPMAPQINMPNAHMLPPQNIVLPPQPEYPVVNHGTTYYPPQYFPQQQPPQQQQRQPREPRGRSNNRNDPRSRSKSRDNNRNDFNKQLAEMRLQLNALTAQSNETKPQEVVQERGRSIRPKKSENLPPKPVTEEVEVTGRRKKKNKKNQVPVTVTTTPEERFVTLPRARSSSNRRANFKNKVLRSENSNASIITDVHLFLDKSHVGDGCLFTENERKFIIVPKLLFFDSLTVTDGKSELKYSFNELNFDTASKYPGFLISDYLEIPHHAVVINNKKNLFSTVYSLDGDEPDRNFSEKYIESSFGDKYLCKCRFINKILITPCYVTYNSLETLYGFIVSSTVSVEPKTIGHPIYTVMRPGIRKHNVQSTIKRSVVKIADAYNVLGYATKVIGISIPELFITATTPYLLTADHVDADRLYGKGEPTYLTWTRFLPGIKVAAFPSARLDDCVQVNFAKQSAITFTPMGVSNGRILPRLIGKSGYPTILGGFLVKIFVGYNSTLGQIITSNGTDTTIPKGTMLCSGGKTVEPTLKSDMVIATMRNKFNVPAETNIKHLVRHYVKEGDDAALDFMYLHGLFNVTDNFPENSEKHSYRRNINFFKLCIKFDRPHTFATYYQYLCDSKKMGLKLVSYLLSHGKCNVLSFFIAMQDDWDDNSLAVEIKSLVPIKCTVLQYAFHHDEPLYNFLKNNLIRRGLISKYLDVPDSDGKTILEYPISKPDLELFLYHQIPVLHTWQLLNAIEAHNITEVAELYVKHCNYYNSFTDRGFSMLDLCVINKFQEGIDYFIGIIDTSRVGQFYYSAIISDNTSILNDVSLLDRQFYLAGSALYHAYKTSQTMYDYIVADLNKHKCLSLVASMKNPDGLSIKDLPITEICNPCIADFTEIGTPRNHTKGASMHGYHTFSTPGISYVPITVETPAGIRQVNGIFVNYHNINYVATVFKPVGPEVRKVGNLYLTEHLVKTNVAPIEMYDSVLTASNIVVEEPLSNYTPCVVNHNNKTYFYGFIYNTKHKHFPLMLSTASCVEFSGIDTNYNRLPVRIQKPSPTISFEDGHINITRAVNRDYQFVTTPHVLRTLPPFFRNLNWRVRNEFAWCPISIDGDLPYILLKGPNNVHKGSVCSLVKPSSFVPFHGDSGMMVSYVSRGLACTGIVVGSCDDGVVIVTGNEPCAKVSSYYSSKRTVLSSAMSIIIMFVSIVTATDYTITMPIIFYHYLQVVTMIFFMLLLITTVKVTTKSYYKAKTLIVLMLIVPMLCVDVPPCGNSIDFVVGAADVTTETGIVAFSQNRYYKGPIFGGSGNNLCLISHRGSYITPFGINDFDMVASYKAPIARLTYTFYPVYQGIAIIDVDYLKALQTYVQSFGYYSKHLLTTDSAGTVDITGAPISNCTFTYSTHDVNNTYHFQKSPLFAKGFTYLWCIAFDVLGVSIRNSYYVARHREGKVTYINSYQSMVSGSADSFSHYVVRLISRALAPTLTADCSYNSVPIINTTAIPMMIGNVHRNVYHVGKYPTVIPNCVPSSQLIPAVPESEMFNMISTHAYCNNIDCYEETGIVLATRNFIIPAVTIGLPGTERRISGDDLHCSIATCLTSNFNTYTYSTTLTLGLTTSYVLGGKSVFYEDTTMVLTKVFNKLRYTRYLTDIKNRSSTFLCTNGQVAYVTSHTVSVTFCKTSTCITTLLDSTKTVFVLPRNISILPSNLKITGGYTVEISCPAVHYCDTVTCTFCPEYLDNISCWGWYIYVIVILITVLILSVFGCLGYYYKKVIVVFTTPIFISLMFIHKIFRYIKIMLIILCCAKRSTAFVLSSLTPECTNGVCNTKTAVLMSLPTGALANINVNTTNYNGVYPFMIQAVISSCNQKHLYTTASVNTDVVEYCICSTVGNRYCVYSHCGQTPSHITNLAGNETVRCYRPGNCKDAFCAGFACNFAFKSHTYRANLGFVSTCSSWSTYIIITVNGVQSKISTGETVEIGGFDVTLVAAQTTFDSLMTKKFYSPISVLGNKIIHSEEVYAFDNAADAGSSSPGVLGQVQCGNPSNVGTDCTINNDLCKMSCDRNPCRVYCPVNPIDNFKSSSFTSHLLPLSDLGVSLYNVKNEIFVNHTGTTSVTIGVNVNGLVIGQSEPTSVASISDISISGCYNCQDGAIIKGVCKSSIPIPTFITCATISFVIICNGSFSHYAVYQLSTVDLSCYVRTKVSSQTIQLKGELHTMTYNPQTSGQSISKNIVFFTSQTDYMLLFSGIIIIVIIILCYFCCFRNRSISTSNSSTNEVRILPQQQPQQPFESVYVPDVRRRKFVDYPY